MAPRFQIMKIALVGIGLAFKRDVAVGITAHGQPDQPLDEISEIEEHEQHLALLGCVDALVVHQLIAQVHPVMHKQDSQQIDCRESVERQNRSANYLHRHKGTTFFEIHDILVA